MLAAAIPDVDIFAPDMARTRRMLAAALLSLAVHATVAWVWLSGHGARLPLFEAPQTLEVTLVDPPSSPPAAAPQKSLPHPMAPTQTAIAPGVIATATAVPADPAPAAQTALTPGTPPASMAETAQPAAGETTRTPPHYQAAYLHNPPPAYPLSAKRRGMEGRVMLHAEIQPDGLCSRIELTQSSGWDILDQAALNAVRGWRFEPARQGTQAIVAWVDIPITFRLEN